MCALECSSAAYSAMLKEAVHNFVVVPSGQYKLDKDSSPALINVFIAFQLFGLLGALIMLFTTALFRSQAPRHAAWYSFILSWIISCLSYTLLFWAGHLAPQDPVPYTLCFIQGIFIHAAPPLTAGTTLGLVTQIWLLLRSATTTGARAQHISPLLLTATLIIPYMMFVGIMVTTLVIGWKDPQTVERSGSGMYCSFTNVIPGRLSSLLCIVILVPAVVLEVLVCRMLHSHWGAFRAEKYAKSMVLRVTIFALVGILAVCLSFVFFFIIDHAAVLNIVISVAPVAAVLIFGTQADLYRVYMFWRKRPQTER